MVFMYTLDIKTSTGTNCPVGAGSITGKEAEERAMKTGGSATTASSNIVSTDQQSSTNVALRDHLRIASRDVKRSIKNRWSGNGIGTVTGESPTSATSFSADEHQGLLSGAAEQPFDSPMPQARTHKQQPSMVSVATSTDNPNINNAMDEFPSNAPTSYYTSNQHHQNFDNSIMANYSSSTANDAAPPPYQTTYPTNSQRSVSQPHTSNEGSQMYVTTYGTQQAQHIMDTPSTSQLQRTINRTLLGGNESTMLSEALETTIC